jgi:hypothetical protein
MPEIDFEGLRRYARVDQASCTSATKAMGTGVFDLVLMPPIPPVTTATLAITMSPFS